MEEKKEHTEEQKKEKEKKTHRTISWKGHEYTHYEKSVEWFWALGLIVVSGALTALVFQNLLFAIFILIAGFVLAIFASRHPREVDFSITHRGVRIDDKLYPYQTLESFGIEELTPKHVPKLILRSKKTLTLDIVISLEHVDVNEVHDFLKDVLPEEEHLEPLTHKIMESLGF